MTRNKLLIFLISFCFLSSFARESLYVFTSKGIYETCEDLWFKCVAFDDGTLRVSDRSHTAYVEIVDPADSVVWKEKYRMSNGMCDGHVYVGEDWQPGEYRMFVHTRSSLGREDTVVYPKRLLIVNELPQVPEYLKTAKERVSYIDIPDSAMTGSLNVVVALDSAEYHTRSKVRATVKVTDTDGKPVRAVLAMSVADALYSYPLTDVDIQSFRYGNKQSLSGEKGDFQPILSDGVASGYLKSGGKKESPALDGQYVNVFDETAEKGALNIIATGSEGYFEVSPEMGSSLGKILLLKPLVDEDLKPHIVFNDSFKDIAGIRKGAIEKDRPVIRKIRLVETEDTVDYSGRHFIQLEEIEVKGKGNHFPKRNKVMGYLDSIALSMHSAWVCCGGWVKGEYVGGWLNDYRDGYTHHPSGGQHDVKYPPKNVTTPVRGKMYNMVKYRWSEKLGLFLVADEQRVHYMGPNYSEEELLAMENISKTDGYYPKRRFRLPPEEEMIPEIEDFRNTLLWLPRVQTDANGEFNVEFPTSDIRSTFRLNGFILVPDTGEVEVIDEYFIVR